MVTKARAEEFASIRETIRSWAVGDAAIVAVALVGSWARGEPRMDSDADVLVLTETDRFVEQDDWVSHLCGSHAALVRTADWGALTERRVRLRSGFEIEFGFAKPSWAEIAPMDPGTREVITDGCETWYDPNNLLRRLLDAAVE
ncbi:MAG: nucleotidyltransferase domain-containing protein [Acidimicrobiia bacterium]